MGLADKYTVQVTGDQLDKLVTHVESMLDMDLEVDEVSYYEELLRVLTSAATDTQ